MAQNLPDDQISAAHALAGRTLKSGWIVKEKASAKPGSTGGHFSVCYLVEKEGRSGFLKALNFLKFLRDEQTDMNIALAEMINTFNFEKELLSRCRDRNFSKVSRMLDSGQENIPGFIFANVLYIIFEKADGDVREQINFAKNIDIAWKLRSLHNICVGLRQLHSIEVSHQDLKPSNVFIFENTVSKLGDLGRSLCKSLDGPHSNTNFAGDRNYIPPEVIFSYALPDWNARAFAIDCYMLGSMAIYYFLGTNMTALLAKHIDPKLNWMQFGGRYKEVLPYLIDAFENSLKTLSDHISDIEFKDGIVEVVRMLCHPDPERRGHPKDIASRSNNYNLERFITRLNILATKAEYQIK